MSEKRVNSETGVIEERGFFGWHAAENENGREERVNPDTGVCEEKGLFGWHSSENENGREERVNPDTGVHEEKGLFGWHSSENENGREERVNPVTGVHEEKGLFGWHSSENKNGREERANPDTGVHEERALLGWHPSETSGSKPCPPPRHREQVEELQQLLGEDEDFEIIEEDDQNFCPTDSEYDDDGKDADDFESQTTATERGRLISFSTGNGIIQVRHEGDEPETIIAKRENETVYLTRSGRVRVCELSRSSGGFSIFTTTFNTLAEYKEHVEVMKLVREGARRSARRTRY